LSIRSLDSRDVKTILTIQSACPEIAQWTNADYERVAQGEMSGWISADPAVARRERAPGSQPAEVGSPQRPDEGFLASVNGFLVARRVATDMEILNFAVRPDARHKGTGAALLQAALDWARTFSAERAILEVRSANETALRFYERHQFQIVGRRRNYYTSPTDDALLLTLQIK
jgi:ribosomal protein S18 acetylase RimI-like enzyme